MAEENHLLWAGLEKDSLNNPTLFFISTEDSSSETGKMNPRYKFSPNPDIIFLLCLPNKQNKNKQNYPGIYGQYPLWVV